VLERHLKLGPPLRKSGWRNIAIGTWRSAKDPTVYGLMDLRCDKALEYTTALAQRTGERVNITHFLAKAVAECFKRHPEINAVLRFGRIYPRKYVTLFLQVATDDEGKDLSGITVREAEGKSIVDIAAEINRKARAVKDRSDKSYDQMKGLMSLLPGWLAGFVLDAAGFLQFTLNLWSPLLGTPKDPLGSVMITNVGSLGIDCAFAPLVAYSRVPMVLTAGAVQDQVVVEDGQPVVRPVLRLGVTFDHRLIDGVHAAKLSKLLTAIFRDPSAYLG
jgi:pyruvate/2-oxoglutarate dehydrogenase complex dihydrolipoamide acyltransferase (E2) component